MVYEIELVQLLREILDPLLLPPLHRFVLSYSGCDFEGHICSSQETKEEHLKNMFFTQTGKLVITTMHSVGRLGPKKTMWIISPCEKQKEIRQVGWNYPRILNMEEMKEINEYKVPVQDSMGRLDFYTEKKTGTLASGLFGRGCLSGVGGTREFDTDESLNVEQVVKCSVVRCPAFRASNGSSLMFTFTLSCCESPTSYPHINKAKTIENVDLWIPKKEICFLKHGFHKCKLDSITQLESYAVSKDVLALSTTICHVKTERQDYRVFEQNFPCTVIW